MKIEISIPQQEKVSLFDAVCVFSANNSVLHSQDMDKILYQLYMCSNIIYFF